jgi:hypothetical protein
VLNSRRADKIVGRSSFRLGGLKSTLRHPNFVGAHWHQFGDQPTTGRFDGENFQNGFVDVCDTPYAETIAGIRQVGYRLYEIRANQ